MRIRFLITLTSFGVIFLGFMPHLKAAGNIQALQLSPGTVSLDADAGGTYSVKMKIWNNSADTVDFKAAINNFANKDESGAPRVLSDSEDPKEPSLNFKTWVSAIPEMSVAPKTEKNFSVIISVPENAGPGGHYGIIRFYQADPNGSPEGNSVGISASIGSLFLIRVAGDIHENLSVKNFYIAKNGKLAGFVETGPLTIVSRFENTGNVHVKPEGLLTIKNMFGSTVASLQITDSPGNVLPGSIRKFEQTLKNKWLFGKYTVTMNAKYGAYNTVILGKTTFWAFPYKLIFILILMLATIWFGGRKLLKRYNQRVIAKHSGK